MAGKLMKAMLTSVKWMLARDVEVDGYWTNLTEVRWWSYVHFSEADSTIGAALRLGTVVENVGTRSSKQGFCFAK